METALMVMAFAVGSLGTLVVLMLRKTMRQDSRDISLNLVLPEEFRFVHKTVTESKNSILDKDLSKDNNVTGDYRIEWEALLGNMPEDAVKQAFIDDDEAYLKVYNRMRPITKEKFLEMKTLHDFISKRT